MAEPIETAKKKSPAKMLIVLGAILLIEAVAIVGAMMVFGGPSEVAAEADTAQVVAPEDEKIQEILVLDAKLANNKSGLTFIYDTEIYVQVRKKHADRVTGELERYRNEIKAQITTIWRTSEPHHFQEPKLENLNRKVAALLGDRFGSDPHTAQPVISKVVIVMGTGIRVDG